MKIANAVRAVGSAAALVGLVVGIPWLLVSLAGWPLPSAWPDWSQVWMDLRQLNIDGRRVIAVLAVGAWLLWAQVLWALAFEALNMVKAGHGLVSRPAPLTLPAVSMLVSRLVAGVVSITLVTSSPASGRVAGSIGSELPPVSELVDDAIDIDLDFGPTAGDPAVERPATVLVMEDETAWDVATRVFGDGNRVADLLDHNRISAFDVRAGVTLELPPGVSAPESEVTVVEGDHLWGISTRRLQEAGLDDPSNAQIAAHVAEMVEANRPCIENPDLINPDDVFTLPALGRSQPANDQAVTADRGSVDPLVALNTPPVTPSLVPSSETSETMADGGRSANGAEPVLDDHGAEPGPQVDEDNAVGEDNRNVPVGLVAVSGVGLVTAAIGGIIVRNQARRIGGRRPGTAPRFDVPHAADRLISETSDGGALADLDRALRYLGARLSADGLALPDLVGVLIGSDDIRLLVATPHNAAPNPFDVEREGMVWSITRPVPMFDVPGALNPYPTLVSVGYTESAQLLIDIEYVGALNLTGGFADVVDAMGTLALQLATSPLADTIEVVCVGFGEELADLERITVVSSIDAVRPTIRDHAAGTASLVDMTGNTGPAGRADGVGDWTPMVVFDPLSELDGDSSELLDAATETRIAGVSAVVHSVESAALTMELSEDRVVIPSYRVSLDRRPLTRVERTDLSSAVAAAKKPDHSEQPDLVSSLGSQSPSAKSYPPPHRPPADDDPGSDADETHSGETHSYIVRLLGPLRVEDRSGRTVQFARSATPEFLAYMTHHRNGVEVGHVMSTLWPSTTARRTWIANVYADAARSLATPGTTPGGGLGNGDGVTLTPRPGADDEYRLADGVTSDVERFRALVTTAISRPVDDAVELLIDALAMIEGIPYSNITSRWPIAEGHWQDATVMIDEAARCVAALALDHFDDPSRAEWATARGLLASPHSVELHRLRLRAAIALESGAGDPAGSGPGRSNGEQQPRSQLSPDAVFQHYQAVVMADDHRPEASSQLDADLVELYDSYRRSRPAPVRAIDSDTLERRR